MRYTSSPWGFVIPALHLLHLINPRKPGVSCFHLEFQPQKKPFSESTCMWSQLIKTLMRGGALNDDCIEISSSRKKKKKSLSVMSGSKSGGSVFEFDTQTLINNWLNDSLEHQRTEEELLSPVDESTVKRHFVVWKRSLRSVDTACVLKEGNGETWEERELTKWL